MIEKTEKNHATPQLRSDRVTRGFIFLLKHQYAYARELSDVMGIPTKEVYPSLRNLLLHNVITKERVGIGNIYRIKQSVINYMVRMISAYRKPENFIKMVFKVFRIPFEEFDIKIIKEIVKMLQADNKKWLGGNITKLAEDIMNNLDVDTYAEKIIDRIISLVNNGILAKYDQNGQFKIKINRPFEFLLMLPF